ARRVQRNRPQARLLPGAAWSRGCDRDGDGVVAVGAVTHFGLSSPFGSKSGVGVLLLVRHHPPRVCDATRWIKPRSAISLNASGSGAVVCTASPPSGVAH